MNSLRQRLNEENRKCFLALMTQANKNQQQRNMLMGGQENGKTASLRHKLTGKVQTEGGPSTIKNFLR